MLPKVRCIGLVRLVDDSTMPGEDTRFEGDLAVGWFTAKECVVLSDSEDIN